jgi:hypothetical protein
VYEERITLWLATDFDHALAQAEDEAAKYAKSDDVEFLGLSQAYALPDTVTVTNVEIFSLLRESTLDSVGYIKSFFKTGKERQQ